MKKYTKIYINILAIVSICGLSAAATAQVDPLMMKQMQQQQQQQIQNVQMNQQQQQAQMMQMMQKQALQQQQQAALEAQKQKQQQDAMKKRMEEQAACNTLAQGIANQACGAVRKQCQAVTFSNGYYTMKEMQGWYNCRTNVFNQYRSIIDNFKADHPECSVTFSSNASC